MMKDIHNSNGLLSKENEILLRTLETGVDCIAEAFGSNCEVLLHSLEDMGHTVVKIVNGHITGRKVGSPMTDLGLDILKEAKSTEEKSVGGHYSKLDDGRLLKSAYMVVRNTHGSPIGLMCINIDLSVSLLDFMRELLPKDNGSSKKIVEHYPLTPDELVNRTLQIVMSRVKTKKEISPSKKNRAIVTELYKKGIFKVAGVIDIVAKQMSISRYTVYNYIRSARVEVEDEE